VSMISVQALAAEYGYSANHIIQLVKRGQLPEGTREGRERYLPEAEARLALSTHQTKEHWKKGRKRNRTKKTNWFDGLV